MTLEIDFTLDELKNFIRVEHNADDFLIPRFKNSAISEVDSYLNNDFEGLIIPPDVALWIMNRTASYYENRGNVPKPDFSSVERYRKYPFGNDEI